MYIRPNKMNMRYSIIELYIVTSNVFLITDHLAVTSSTIYPFSIYVKDLVKSDACFFIQIIICQSDEVCAFLIVSRLKLYPISSLFLHRVLVWAPLKTELEKGSLFGKWWERKGWKARAALWRHLFQASEAQLGWFLCKVWRIPSRIFLPKDRRLGNISTGSYSQ